MPTGASGKGRHAAPKRTRSAAPSPRSRGASASKGRPGARPALSRANRASRESEALVQKRKNSSKAAGKGAILILAIALIAIKAFSSLPSTVKTSSDKSVPTTQSSSVLKASPKTAGSRKSTTSGSAAITNQVVPPPVTPSTTVPPRVTTNAVTAPSKGAVTASGNSLVTVRVFNATTVPGAAAKTTNVLAQAGYDVVAPTDASVHNVKVTEIYYSPGYQSQASQLCAVLGISTASEKPISYASPLPSIQPSDLNVVLGSDKAS